MRSCTVATVFTARCRSSGMPTGSKSTTQVIRWSPMINSASRVSNAEPDDCGGVARDAVCRDERERHPGDAGDDGGSESLAPDLRVES